MEKDALADFVGDGQAGATRLHPCARRGCSELTAERLCPAHRRQTARMAGRHSAAEPALFWPHDMQPSRVPLTIVSGPSGAGKTHLVAARAAPGDQVIDLDAITSEISGEPWYAAGRRWLELAVIARNQKLRRLAEEDRGGRAWFIVAAPSAAERRHWRTMLGAAEVIVLAVPLDRCVARLAADRRRGDQVPKFTFLAARWWRDYTPGDDETVIVE